MGKTTAMAVMILLAGCGSPPEPGEEAPRSELTVTGTVGVELEDPDYVFGDIIGFELFDHGGFAVLDMAAANLRVYDETGTIQTVISRRGSGPGELVQPYGLLVYPSGDYGILDPNQGGLLRFSPEGEYLGLEFEAVQNIPANTVMVLDSFYVANRTAILHQAEPLEIEAFIGRFPLTWEPDVKYTSKTVPLDPSSLANFALESMFLTPWAADPATGTVYIAPYSAGEFRIEVYDTGGNEQGHIAIHTEPVEKTPEEIEAEVAYYDAVFRAMEGGTPFFDTICDPPRYRHPVRSMTVDDTGNLWVYRGDTDEVVFTVFDGEGTRTADWLLPGVPGGEDLIFRVSGGRMALFSQNPQDWQRVWLVDISL